MKFFELDESLRFVCFGFINTLVGYILYLILLLFLAYPLAYTLTYLAGIYISYYLNTVFVFKKRMNAKKAFQYPVVYVVQYLLGISLLSLFVTIFKINVVAAPLIVTATTFPITFIISRRIISQ